MGSTHSVDRVEMSKPSRTGRSMATAVPLPEDFVTQLKSLPLDVLASFAFPGEPAYTSNATCWNYDAIGSPSAIFTPTSEDQLSAFLKFWSMSPLPEPHSLTVAGGRHSHWGMKDHSIVVDMSKFNDKDVDVESKTGRYGAGLRLREFDAFNKSKGLATTAGTNPDTGIAGLTMGGGFGHLCRRYGLTVDNLIGVRAVLANGDVVEATPDNEHSDLLWAVRGGGGNFGIVTQFRFKLFPRGDIIMGASVFLTHMLNDIPAILLEWSNFCAKAHKDLSMMAVLPSSGPALVLPSAYIGDDLSVGGEGDQLLAPLTKIGHPMINAMKRAPYCEGPKWPGNDLQSSGLKQQAEGNWYESGVLLRELTPGSIEVMLRFTTNPAFMVNKTSHIVLCYLGGAINDVADMDSSVGFRSASIFCMVLGTWANQSTPEAYTAERKRVAKWTKDLLIALAPYSVASYNTLGDVALDGVKSQMLAAGQQVEAESIAESKAHTDEQPAAVSPVGFTEGAVPVLVPAAGSGGQSAVDVKCMSAWSEEQFAKLQSIKTKYDPKNIFKNNNNIKPKQ